MRQKAKVQDIRCRIGIQLKQDAEAILSDCGLSLAGAVRVFLEQVVKSHGLPFVVRSKTQEELSYDELLRRKAEIGMAQLKKAKVFHAK